MIKIPKLKILKKSIMTIFHSNFPVFLGFFVFLKRFFLFNFIVDFLFTFFSVHVAEYAIEINPLVNLITPFGALILNIFLFRLLRFFSITNFLLLLVFNGFYFSANINHFVFFLDVFLDGLLAVYQVGL